MQTQFFILSFSDFGMIKHLMDRASPNIRFVVQVEADVGLSFASSNISLDLHNKSNVRLGAVQQVYNVDEDTGNMSLFLVNCMYLSIPNILHNGFKNVKEDTIKLLLLQNVLQFLISELGFYGEQNATRVHRKTARQPCWRSG